MALEEEVLQRSRGDVGAKVEGGGDEGVDGEVREGEERVKWKKSAWLDVDSGVHAKNRLA